jgi:hypothetical protein
MKCSFLFEGRTEIDHFMMNIFSCKKERNFTKEIGRLDLMELV